MGQKCLVLPCGPMVVDDWIKVNSYCHIEKIVPTWLPKPNITIVLNQANFGRIIQTFQDLRYIGKLRQRWEEIKKFNARA